jgi:arylsulfatase A-like enzyme
MKRRDLLRSAFAAPFALAQANAKPNIVLIVADDLGYGELGVQDATDIATPNIDSIAKNGVRFTSGYVSCPVCSPTRAGLLTGRYQQRFGHEFNPGNTPAEKFGLPLTESTVADRLKAVGYATGIIGKWHLGFAAEYHPLNRGFDEFFGFLGGAHSYIDARAGGANPILRGTEAVDEKEYLTDALTREAAAFVNRRRGRPFFLYLAYNAVHGPMQASRKYLSRYAGIADEKRRTFAGMLAALDDGVGEVLKSLPENTLVMFVSDNGGPTPVTTSRNTPLRDKKGSVYEGGIRVPLLMHWNGRLPRGRTYDSPVIALDLFATAVAAAGGSLDRKVEGVDLAPFVTGKRPGVPHDALFWRFGTQRAVRAGDWKLVDPGYGTWELFDLKSDPGERTNLNAAESDRAKKLISTYEAWNAANVTPLWKTNRMRPRRRRRPRALRRGQNR